MTDNGKSEAQRLRERLLAICDDQTPGDAARRETEAEKKRRGVKERKRKRMGGDVSGLMLLHQQQQRMQENSAEPERKRRREGEGGIGERDIEKKGLAKWGTEELVGLVSTTPAARDASLDALREQLEISCEREGESKTAVMAMRVSEGLSQCVSMDTPDMTFTLISWSVRVIRLLTESMTARMRVSGAPPPMAFSAKMRNAIREHTSEGSISAPIVDLLLLCLSRLESKESEQELERRLEEISLSEFKRASDSVGGEEHMERAANHLWLPALLGTKFPTPMIRFLSGRISDRLCDELPIGSSRLRSLPELGSALPAARSCRLVAECAIVDIVAAQHPSVTHLFFIGEKDHGESQSGPMKNDNDRGDRDVTMRGCERDSDVSMGERGRVTALEHHLALLYLCPRLASTCVSVFLSLDIPSDLPSSLSIPWAASIVRHLLLFAKEPYALQLLLWLSSGPSEIISELNTTAGRTAAALLSARPLLPEEIGMHSFLRAVSADVELFLCKVFEGRISLQLLECVILCAGSVTAGAIVTELLKKPLPNAPNEAEELLATLQCLSPGLPQMVLKQLCLFEAPQTEQRERLAAWSRLLNWKRVDKGLKKLMVKALLKKEELSHLLSLLSSSDTALRCGALALVRQLFANAELETSEAVSAANELFACLFCGMRERMVHAEAEAHLQLLLELLDEVAGTSKACASWILSVAVSSLFSAETEGIVHSSLSSSLSPANCLALPSLPFFIAKRPTEEKNTHGHERESERRRKESIVVSERETDSLSMLQRNRAAPLPGAAAIQKKLFDLPKRHQEENALISRTLSSDSETRLLSEKRARNEEVLLRLFQSLIARTSARALALLLTERLLGLHPTPSDQQYQELLPRQSNFDADVFLRSLFHQSPLLFPLLVQLARAGEGELDRLYAVVRSLLASLIGDWHRLLARGGSAPGLEERTGKVLLLLKYANWLPQPVCECYEIVGLLPPAEAVDVLMVVWRCLQQYGPAPSAAQWHGLKREEARLKVALRPHVALVAHFYRHFAPAPHK